MLGLVPYFEQPSIDLGFAPIYGWGLMVAIGFLLGAALCARGATRDGLDPRVSYDYALWVFVGGFIGAHLIHVLFYEPEMLERDPLSIFYIWEGVSSYGGFFGAFITTVLFFRLRRQRFMLYANSLALGFALAWTIARVGCFLAHDHIGVESNFFLAVDFPEGPRHDLGLYEAILMGVILGVMWLVGRRYPPGGTLAGLMMVLYAPTRFFLEFLRATDARYALDFTPAQFGSFALLALGLALMFRARREPRPPYASLSASSGEPVSHR